MNAVAIIGRISKAPEMRYTQSGEPVANASIAVDRMKSDDEADFFDVVIFGKQAEFAAQYLDKGAKVGIEGRLQQNRWTNDAGQNRSRVEIVCHRIEALETKAEAERRRAGGSQQQAPPPAQQRQQAPAPQTRQPEPEPDPFGDINSSDDPFGDI